MTFSFPRSSKIVFASVVAIMMTIDVQILAYQNNQEYRLANFIRRRKLDHCSSPICQTDDDCCLGYNCVKNGLFQNLGFCLKSGNNLCLVDSSGETKDEKPCLRGYECLPIHDSLLPLGICAPEQQPLPRKRYFEICETTLDCDTQKKLCCRQHQPAKGQSRRRCSYYRSALEECIF